MKAQGASFFMDNSNPFYLWKPKDAFSDIQMNDLTLIEEGAYRRLLDFCYINGWLPNDNKSLTRIVGKGCDGDVINRVKPLFYVVGDKLYSDIIQCYKKETFCYIAYNPDTLLYKIGASSNLINRSSSLKQHGKNITIICFFIGGFQKERELHTFYESVREQGEWFNLTQKDLDIIISENQAQYFSK